MEATSKAQAKRGTVHGERRESYATAVDVAAAFRRYSAGVYEVVHGLVDDPEKTNRITQAAFIASCQALAVGADTQSHETPSSNVEPLSAAECARSRDMPTIPRTITRGRRSCTAATRVELALASRPTSRPSSA